MRLTLACLSMALIFTGHLFSAEQTPAQQLMEAKRLAKDHPKDALGKLISLMGIASDSMVLDIAELGANLLKDDEKYDEALKWCDWGLERAKYLGLEVAGMRRLQDLKAGIQRKARDRNRAKEIASEGEDAILFREAKRCERNGDHQMALAKYQQIQNKFPKSNFFDAATVGIGRSMLWLWRCPEAWALLSKFVDLNPKGPYRDEALLVMGDILLVAQCKAKEAADAYTKALDVASDGRASQKETLCLVEQRLAIVAFVTGDRKSAAEHLGKAKALSEQSARQKGLGLDVLEDYLTEKSSPTPAWVTIEGGPNVRVALILGDIWYALLDFERSRAAFNLVLDKQRLLSQATKDQRAYATMQLALINDNTFNIQECERLYRRVLSEYPNSRVTRLATLKLGIVLYNQTKRYQEASDMLLALAEKNPSFEHADYAFYLAGWMRATRGEFEVAENTLSRFRRQYPKSKFVDALARDIEEERARKAGHWKDGRKYDDNEGWEEEK